MRHFVAIVCFLASAPALAWSGCRHEAPRALTENLEGIRAVEIWALAGSLEVRGSSRADLSAEGRACTSDEARLPEVRLTSRRLDDVLQIRVEMPEGDYGYAVLDMEVELPDSLPVRVSDSSGDLEIRGVASLELTDSSGDVEISDVPGEVTVLRDSSGDMEIRRVGPVTIEVDSSGNVDVESAASVAVRTDTSGDLRFRDIRGDVAVGSDSSGDIVARGVGGRFTVEADTSGEIRTRDVVGEVRLPVNKR